MPDDDFMDASELLGPIFDELCREIEVQADICTSLAGRRHFPGHGVTLTFEGWDA